MEWLKGRIKEMSSWSGASLIAFGLLIVLGGPFVKIAAYAVSYTHLTLPTKRIV